MRIRPALQRLSLPYPLLLPLLLFPPHRGTLAPAAVAPRRSRPSEDSPSSLSAPPHRPLHLCKRNQPEVPRAKQIELLFVVSGHRRRARFRRRRSTSGLPDLRFLIPVSSRSSWTLPLPPPRSGSSCSRAPLLLRRGHGRRQRSGEPLVTAPLVFGSRRRAEAISATPEAQLARIRSELVQHQRSAPAMTSWWCHADVILFFSFLKINFCIYFPVLICVWHVDPTVRYLLIFRILENKLNFENSQNILCLSENYV
jgi:hypothetical protein